MRFALLTTHLLLDWSFSVSLYFEHHFVPPIAEVEIGPMLPFKDSEKDGGRRAEPMQVELSPGSFDLDSYIQNYSGYTKIARLVFIADRCKELEIPAYKMAVAELKKTQNTSLYVTIYNKAGDRLSSVVPIDHQWQEAVDKKAQQQIERLEVELTNSRTNLIKESIRSAYHELADVYCNRGELSNALKMYARSRDYCGSSKQVVALSLAVVRVGVDLGNYSHVINYVAKAQQASGAVPSNAEERANAAKLKAAVGLAELAARKYKLAAKAFVDAPFEPTTSGTEQQLIAPADVALYGALCAMATMERSELKKRVLDNADFRHYLETAPHVSALVNDFYGSRYTQLLGALQQLQPSWLLDIHLADHAAHLVRQVRSKALVQYCSPFSLVDLHRMADAFGTPLPQLERELAALIIDGSLAQARIDSSNKRLYARQTDQRAAVYEKALAVGAEFAAQASQLQLRVQLLRSDLALRGPKQHAGQSSSSLGPSSSGLTVFSTGSAKS
eukprot:TRINITY_DN7301_c0_g1_i1.p1 TRINITY_DN7301_c0_g1~~TRINITY_DN7301_c0_g1_i1.p1  ORF type:complete len:502 (+),score=174.11 TRINITY_DN7301_c0_g1_i1:841-2346(+)